MLLLGGVVPHVDFRAELHLLDLDLSLVLARLLRLDGLDIGTIQGRLGLVDGFLSSGLGVSRNLVA